MAFDHIPITAIDLFCGAGGLSRGLEDCGIHVQLGIEMNPTAAATYQHNLPGIVLIDDIRNITAEMIMQQLYIQSGNLFLLAGCPPCQTFSSLQRDHTEDDDRNFLIFEYIRLVHEIRPLFILLENVPGLKRGRGKVLFERATAQLEQWYQTESAILNCADYGIPQTRKRLVLHGIRRDAFQLLKNTDAGFMVSLPMPTHTEHPDTDLQLQPWVPSARAFAGLPAVAAGSPAPEGYPNHETNNLSDTNIQRIRYIRNHGGSRECLPTGLQLTCHKKKNVVYSGVYGIIDDTQPAPTMTGGCINFTKGRYGHPTQDRAITVREAARLQSFRDDFIFTGTRGQTALQVGNAVPPLLAKASGQYFLHILHLLHQIPG